MATAWLTDINNDTYLDEQGHIALATNNIGVVAQLCNNVLQEFLGEEFVDSKEGTDWFGILLNDDVSIDSKNQHLIDRLKTISLVKSVNAINYNQDIQSGLISYTINITSVYGKLVVSQKVGL